MYSADPEGGEGVSEIEEAQELQEALEWTLAQIAGNVAEFRSSHTDAETVVAIRQAHCAGCAARHQLRRQADTYVVVLLLLRPVRFRL